ncbi:DUF401 family protein [Chloroflexota bacterium]
MISSSLALLISIALTLALIVFHVIPGLAILSGGLALALLVLPISTIPVLFMDTLIDSQTLQLLLIIASALTMSRFLETKGLLTMLAGALESIGPRVSITLTPAVIGLVPMPAGALVSAAAVKDLVPRLGLKPAEATFINYWFRHIWEFSMPMYPAIIATHIILNVPLGTITAVFLPMTVLAGLVGLVSAKFILRSKQSPATSKIKTRELLVSLVTSAWPILLLVALVLAGVEAWIAFPAVLVVVMVQQKVHWSDLKSSLRYGLEPKILVLLIAVMLFKEVIETSGVASALIADMDTLRLPLVLIIAFLPFLIGVAAGFGMAFVGITFPLLAPLLTQGGSLDQLAMLLAYVSGIAGILVSPLHLCFLLSTEYFNARLLDVYRYVIPAVAVIEVIALGIYLLFGSGSI